MVFQEPLPHPGVFILFQGTGAVQQPSPGHHIPGAVGQDLFLQGRELTQGPFFLGPPGFRSPVQDSQAAAGSIHQHPVGGIFPFGHKNSAILFFRPDAVDSQPPGIFPDQGQFVIV